MAIFSSKMNLDYGLVSIGILIFIMLVLIMYDKPDPVCKVEKFEPVVISEAISAAPGAAPETKSEDPPRCMDTTEPNVVDETAELIKAIVDENKPKKLVSL